MTDESMENENEPKEGLNNILTVRIIEKYLAYCSGIVKTSLKEGSESYNAQSLFKEIGDELTEEILFGCLQKGGKVTVGRKNNKMTFRYLE